MPSVSTNASTSSASSGNVCLICGNVFYRKGDLTRHRRTHGTQPSDMKYVCDKPGCNFGTDQIGNFKTHLNSKHLGIKPNHCPDCGFQCSDPGSLIRHRKSLHGYVPKQRKPRQPPIQLPDGPPVGASKPKKEPKGKGKKGTRRRTPTPTPTVSDSVDMEDEPSYGNATMECSASTSTPSPVASSSRLRSVGEVFINLSPSTEFSATRVQSNVTQSPRPSSNSIADQ